MQSFHERKLLGSKSLSYSSTHTLELTEAAKSQLPPIRCTSANIEVHEYYRVMKSATLYSAALGWVVIVTAFVEGELTWRRGGNDTLFADCLRALNIVLSLLQVVFIVRFYQTVLKTRVARGLVHNESKD